MRVTIDTSVLPAEEVLAVCRGCGFDYAVVSVTEREVEGSSFETQLRAVERLTETAVCGESRWGGAVWGSSESSDRLESILRIISNGSFPPKGDRANLSPGQRRQLRDAMILEAHVRSGCDLFITNDETGFVNDGRREILETQYGTRIMTAKEFCSEYGRDSGRSN